MEQISSWHGLSVFDTVVHPQQVDARPVLFLLKHRSPISLTDTETLQDLVQVQEDHAQGEFDILGDVHRNLHRAGLGSTRTSKGQGRETCVAETSSNHFVVYSVHEFLLFAGSNIGFLVLACYATTQLHLAIFFIVLCFAAAQLARHIRNAHSWCAVIKVARNEGTGTWADYLVNRVLTKKGHI